MKTKKIFKKFRQVDLSTKITLKDENLISVDILKKRLDDPDMERLLEVFPPKKYNISIKADNNNLSLEISKCPKPVKMRFPEYPPICTDNYRHDRIYRGFRCF